MQGNALERDSTPGDVAGVTAQPGDVTAFSSPDCPWPQSRSIPPASNTWGAHRAFPSTLGDHSEERSCPVRSPGAGRARLVTLGCSDICWAPPSPEQELLPSPGLCCPSPSPTLIPSPDTPRAHPSRESLLCTPAPGEGSWGCPHCSRGDQKPEKPPCREKMHKLGAGGRDWGGRGELFI